MTGREEETVAARLQEAIGDPGHRGVSVNALGRQLAELDPQGRSAKSWARSLRRWLEGGQIARSADAELVAAALGKPRDYFKGGAARRARDDLGEVSRKLDRLLELLTPEAVTSSAVGAAASREVLAALEDLRRAARLTQEGAAGIEHGLGALAALLATPQPATPAPRAARARDGQSK